MTRPNTRTWGVLCAGSAFVIDQATKAAALASADSLAVGVEVLQVMNLVLVRNTGVSFGIFASDHAFGQWPLILLTSAILIGLTVWLIKTREARQAGALGAIIGAGMGNVVDRLRHGGVTDFLDFHYAGYHWPAFNFADATIVLGVATLLLSTTPTARSKT